MVAVQAWGGRLLCLTSAHGIASLHTAHLVSFWLRLKTSTMCCDSNMAVLFGKNSRSAVAMQAMLGGRSLRLAILSIPQAIATELNVPSAYLHSFSLISFCFTILPVTIYFL